MLVKMEPGCHIETDAHRRAPPPLCLAWYDAMLHGCAQHRHLSIPLRHGLPADALLSLRVISDKNNIRECCGEARRARRRMAVCWTTALKSTLFGAIRGYGLTSGRAEPQAWDVNGQTRPAHVRPWRPVSWPSRPTSRSRRNVLTLHWLGHWSLTSGPHAFQPDRSRPC